MRTRDPYCRWTPNLRDPRLFKFDVRLRIRGKGQSTDGANDARRQEYLLYGDRVASQSLISFSVYLNGPADSCLLPPIDCPSMTPFGGSLDP